MDPVMMVLLAVIGVVAVSTIFSAAFTVRTNHVSIVERFGRFSRIAQAGLNFKLPFVETSRDVDLATMELRANIDTKTMDNVFVQLPVSVQFRIGNGEEQVKSAYYKLYNPSTQITSYLLNILLGHIPETTLDDLFLQQPQIALRATNELSEAMKDFGYEIVRVLITDIIPDAGVKMAMNRINAETRNKDANKAQGDAEFVLKVRQAEADAEVKRLAGVGVSLERQAIADGLAEAIKKVAEGADISEEQATTMLLFTNWTDMMRVVGSSKNSTTIFMPSGPEGLTNFQQALQSVLLQQRDNGQA